MTILNCLESVLSHSVSNICLNKQLLHQTNQIAQEKLKYFFQFLTAHSSVVGTQLEPVMWKQADFIYTCKYKIYIICVYIIYVYYIIYVICICTHIYTYMYVFACIHTYVKIKHL